MKRYLKNISNIIIVFTIVLLVTSCAVKSNLMKENLSFINNKEFVLDSNKNIHIAFKDNRISGNSGVNLYMGTYKLQEKNNTLFIVIDLSGTTMMAGSPEDMDKETKYLQSLKGELSFKIDTNKNKISIDKHTFTLKK